MSGVQTPQPVSPREADARVAIDVKALQAAGSLDEARDRFAELVGRHQRRAVRIAFHYLRDAADSDEAVQDAFIKAYMHLATFREELPFEVWFTRILINGCLDRRKARLRRDRWFAPADEAKIADEARPAFGGSAELNPEARLLARERRARLTSAIDKLNGRQRTVFVLCHYGDCTPREVSAITGLNESTVRVHLFRAARKLRGILGGKA
jgi:RNA polymerase sigma-70 factor (ECF subfamily)